MPKTDSKKPITADKFLDLDKRGLSEGTVSGVKKKERKTKKVKDI